MKSYPASVSDLALCQKCPMLFAYKIHLGKKSAWRNGIHGSGNAYGTIFHKHISRVFFEAASKPYHPLHDEIAYAVSVGGFELASVIRENIFMPFIEKNSENFSSGQIIAMAKGVSVWVKAMSEFFMCIPSLTRHAESNMQLIFAEPERKLESDFNFDDGKIYITGRYDALMFNPDKREARLFEFKGYMKSDITVPLSQSLIYSWLIWRNTGIIPSVEIIYLDEGDKQPDIFDSKSIGSMMNPALPELFRSAFDILTLRRKPEILQDKDLCQTCRYRSTCQRDMTKLFTRRKGSSLVSVLVFFLVALMITAQVFFFIGNSAESLSDEREMMRIRLKLDERIGTAKDAIEDGNIRSLTHPVYAYPSPKDVYGHARNWFYTSTRVYESGDATASVDIFNLDYIFLNSNDHTFVQAQDMGKEYQKIFPPLGDNHYLIRARHKLPEGNYIMRQVVVKKGNSNDISSEEVFYW